MSASEPVATPPRREETFRGAVYPQDCDTMGHMNTASYTRMFDQAGQHMFWFLGVDPDAARRGDDGWADVNLCIDYHGEIAAGGLVRVVSRPLAAGRSSLRHEHIMFDAVTGERLATASVVTVAFDLRVRAKRDLPADIRQRVADWEGAGAAGYVTT